MSEAAVPSASLGSTSAPRPAWQSAWATPTVAFVVLVGCWLVCMYVGRQTGMRTFAIGVVRDWPITAVSVYCAVCAAVILIGRSSTRWRDFTNFAAGVGMTFAYSGPTMTAIAVGLALLHFVLAHRLQRHVAMIASFAVTTAALYLGYRLGGRPLDPFGLIALRLLIYAFEAQSAAARGHRLSGFLAFVFSVFLWKGIPFASYLTYRTVRPQRDLDNLGVKQLYRAALCLVLLLVISNVATTVLPSWNEFADLPAPVRWLFVALPYLRDVLRWVIYMDIACGMSNFAGYPSPDGYVGLFRAADTLQFFRGFNTYLVSVYQRVFIFEVIKRIKRGRWYRIHVLAVTVCVAYFLTHFAWHYGPKIMTDTIAELAWEEFLVVVYWVGGFAMWPIVAWLARRGAPLAIRIALTQLSLCVTFFLLFGPTDLLWREDTSKAGSACFLVSVVSPRKCELKQRQPAPVPRANEKAAATSAPARRNRR